MQFHVPQFIDVEDKIFGPLTFKQFVYVVGGAGLCVVIYIFVPSLIAWPLIAVAAGFSLALAFYRVNNKPFIYTVQAAFRYITNPRLFLWKRQESKKTQERQKEEAEQIRTLIQNVSGKETKHDRLRDISFSVDVGNSTKNLMGDKEPVHISPNRSAS